MTHRTSPLIVNPHFILCVALLLCLPACRVAIAQSSKPYLVFAGTTSPDGRYAIAWGLTSGKPIDETHLNDVYADFKTDDPPQITNYVVDLRKGRIVTAIQGCHSFPAESQHHFDITWLRGDRFVVISHGAIWVMRGVYGVALSPDGKVAQIDLQKLIKRDTVRHIDQTTDRGYRKYSFLGRPGDLSIMPHDFELTDSGNLRVKALAYVPKDSPWKYDAQLVYRLHVHGTHCTATLRSIHGKAHIKYDGYNSGHPNL